MRAHWLLVLVACAACKKSQDTPAPPVSDLPPPIPAVEVKRGQDACRTYVEKVCACTVPAATSACGLARALPDAIETGLQVATNPASTRRDVLQANDVVRKTIKECIEQTARLPGLGCP